MKSTFIKFAAILAVLALGVPALQLIAKPEAGEAAANWLTDFNLATERAKAEDKYILLDFTGSDWCPPCQAMHAEVLTQDAFVDYANSKLIPVYVDFPRRAKLEPEQRRANNELADKFNVQGFPTYVLLSPEGKEVFRHVGMFHGGPDGFVSFLKEKEAGHRQRESSKSDAPASS